VYAHAFAIVAGVVAAIVLSSLYGGRMRELDDLLGVDRPDHSHPLAWFVQRQLRPGKTLGNLKALTLRGTSNPRDPRPAVLRAVATAETN
jgi:hypothetical protein